MVAFLISPPGELASLPELGRYAPKGYWDWQTQFKERQALRTFGTETTCRPGGSQRVITSFLSPPLDLNYNYLLPDSLLAITLSAKVQECQE